MKTATFTIYRLGFMTILFITMVACGTSTNFSSLRPSDIVLPSHIDKIVLIDRSKPSKGFNNFVEGLFTGESIGQDYAGRKEVIEALFYTLSTSPKYHIIPTHIELEGSKAGNQMAAPLDWTVLENIAHQYEADAVLAVESYDSDQFTNVDKRTSKSKDKEGNVTYRTTYHADRNIDIKLGYRLYDVKNHRIIDEYTANTGVRDQAEGNTRAQALNQLPRSTRLTDRLSSQAGNIYSSRIAPVYVTESRRYFKKASDDDKLMKQAHKSVVTGDWHRAINYWEQVIGFTSKKKTAGKAAYNIATAYEVLGDLDQAMEWARRSYYDHDFKRAEAYISLLNFKQHEKERLNSQLKDDKEMTTF